MPAATLVKKYQQRVYRLAMRIVRQRQDAEEVVQQTFLSVLEHLDGFRRQAGFATWLMRIATNQALALLRRRASRPTVSLNDPSDDEGGLPRPQFVAEWRNPPEQIAADRETRQVLTEALDFDFLRTRPPRQMDDGETPESSASPYSPEEEEVIAERLKGMGYL